MAAREWFADSVRTALRSGDRTSTVGVRARGEHRAAAEREVPGSLPGPGRQGALAALRPEGRRAAVAGFGDDVGAHGQLRGPEEDAADGRGVGAAVAGDPGGPEADHAARVRGGAAV